MSDTETNYPGPVNTPDDPAPAPPAEPDMPEPETPAEA
jgi:hypothetical protein